MKDLLKKSIVFLLSLSMVLSYTVTGLAADGDVSQTDGPKHVRFAFTSDIHSHVDVQTATIDGVKRQRGGVARLATLLNEMSAGSEGDTIYLDGGDFSQGTLFQAGYISEASELRLLSDVGVDALAIGNHEWDLAGRGFADMLNTAMEKEEKLPPLLCSNLDFSGELTEEQQYVKETLVRYIQKSGQDHLGSTILETSDGVKIGVFGVAGVESIEDSPTSGMKWEDGIEAATRQVNYLKDKCDMIVCVSHSGLESETEGEDIDLARACPDIDLIISGHSHTFLFDPVVEGNTTIVASGEYLAYMGQIDATINEDGTVDFSGHKLNPVDSSVERDPAVQRLVNGFRTDIDRTYLAQYGCRFNQRIAHCSFDFTSLADMYATHDEYPMGDLIADSYLYEAEKIGVDDIDVALVGLGTIRESFTKGDITVADAFDICSLGVGEDQSTGHPIVSAYITGKELKLLVELDASLGPLVSSIKMSYSGLEYKFNTKRAPLDQVTDVYLVRKDGTKKEIYDDKLYKVCCNMYAANMLGMLNGLTRGLLKIVPKYEDGTEVEDFYTCSLKDKEGREVKEWYAFVDYLSSFRAGDNDLPEIPAKYADKMGRKVKYAHSGIEAIRNPGTSTVALMIGIPALIGIIVLIVVVIRARIKKRKMRRLLKKAEEQL